MSLIWIFTGAVLQWGDADVRRGEEPKSDGPPHRGARDF